MLLFVLCRRVAIRGRIRILLGQVRNLLTSAKEYGTRKNVGPQCAEISWQWWSSLEDTVHTAWYFWPPPWAGAGYDPLALPWSYFLPTLSWLLCDDSYSEYMCVSYIKSLTLLTTAEIQRGLFPDMWFHRLIFFFSTWHHAPKKWTLFYAS